MQGQSFSVYSDWLADFNTMSWNYMQIYANSASRCVWLHAGAIVS